MVNQVYAPTAESSTDEFKCFYRDVEAVKKSRKNSDIIFIIDDFNAKVGMECSNEAAEKYALGDQNKRGEMLTDFNKKHNIVISNI